MQVRTRSGLQLAPGIQNVAWDSVLGTRRPRSGLQLAPGIQNVAREWSSGNSKNTKWPTVGSGHSKCGPGIEFWELEDHEVAYSWLRAFKMWPGNGVLGTRRAILRGCPKRCGCRRQSPAAPRHP